MISHVWRVQLPSKTILFLKQAILSAFKPFSNHWMKDCTSIAFESELGENTGVFGVTWKRRTKNEFINSESNCVFGT
jgi:hypothetical protein